MLLRMLRRLWAGALLLLALVSMVLLIRSLAIPAPAMPTPVASPIVQSEPYAARQLITALAGADAETVLRVAGHLVAEEQHEAVRQEAARWRALGWLHRVRLAGCVTRWDSLTECAYLVERWPAGAGERQYVRWWISVDPSGRVVGVE